MLLRPDIQPVFTHSSVHATPQVSKPRGHSKGAFDAWSSRRLASTKALLRRPIMPDLGNQKKQQKNRKSKRPSFISCLFIFSSYTREGDVLRPDMTCLSKGACESLWMNAHVFICMTTGSDGGECVSLKPVTWTQLFSFIFFLCKFYTITPRCSIVFSLTPPLCSL